MDWRPLSVTPDGRVTDVSFDDGKAIFRTRENVDAILDFNKSARNHGHGKRGRHVAKVPATVILQWMNEGIDVFNGEHQEAVARKLNDPDYAYLRTGGGIIGVSNGVAR